MSLDTTLAKGVSYITDSLSLGTYCSGLEGQSVSESSSVSVHGHEIIEHDFLNQLAGDGFVWLLYIIGGFILLSIIFHWRTWEPIKKPSVRLGIYVANIWHGLLLLFGL